MSIVLAYILAAVIAYLGYRARALTWDGAVAACLVGGTIFGFGGLGWALLLVLFFVSSSALSFLGRKDSRKRQAEAMFEKGGRRDAWQVLANGGVAALAALVAGLFGDSIVFIRGVPVPLMTNLMFGAFIGALAEATADTWATELGVLSEAKPRLIISGRPVEPGTSGGVTWLGSLGGLAGAGLFGQTAAIIASKPATSPYALAQVIPGPEIMPLPILLAALAGGALGMLTDSLLGATLQAQYVCPVCNKPTESRVHRCGTTTTLVHGVQWINNDVVNITGTLVGALIGLGIAAVMPFAVIGFL